MSANTNQQICVLAAQIAKCPGFVLQSGQCFNFVLDDLVQHQDLKVNRKTSSIVVQANSNGPFLLEADYNRTYDLFYLNNNLPYFLNPISPRDYDAEFKDPSISNYPYEFMTDLSVGAQSWSGTPQQSTLLSAGQLFVYPQSSGQITLTHRYMQTQPIYVAPQSDSLTIPWFEDQDYLITATATRLMMITDDDRYERYVQRCNDMLKRHLIMEGDEQQVVHSVRLDPRKFRFNRVLKPTKLTD